MRIEGEFQSNGHNVVLVRGEKESLICSVTPANGMPARTRNDWAMAVADALNLANNAGQLHLPAMP